MKGTARRITISAVLTALTVVFLFIGNVFPAGRLALIAVASLFVTAAVIEAGFGAAAFVFAGGAVLGALILPDKTAALLYALFFGYYPIVKSLAERIGAAVLAWAVKLAAFNASLTAVWFLFRALLFKPDYLDWSELIVYAAGNAAFVLYDIGLTKLISLYIARISKNIKKDGRRRGR
jgi:hypothetical protein